ncbi:MAG TPA: aminodeoxychorismate/anthranilate synthase component II [Thermoanaerobaculia bacterium]|nr:aminodeoxychorismate/anthranilate synthase component II [Thermoanaerobaculia bacterium]MBP7812173.1 aminodeoxychorismate/anthranilate synthase component II [Thermoanaerobaculia bacterium]MBP8844935.1 aminodeoxychorismate/anthranilate synthase component II [Thermoanaerobaculia bacterium]HPA94675.1 aminodeoxychorismate/anthranilate synthase component II [Thermoanaerobaculia bacterium]HQN39549.1 aminodeoxychorismate/anthranilate synthase component II [Thermoanaerobaculia bacterium]
MILVVDNYDSFTWNLVQLLAATGAAVEVVRNDAASAAELLARRPAGIVLSPGPGRPETAGVCMELLRQRPEVPLLGVCLGHQALGVACGARCVRAPEVVHGKTSEIHHDRSGLFAGLPEPFAATRYHSLVLEPESLPAELRPVARTADGTLMAIAHRELPYHGVQFHPESFATAGGARLAGNFLALCAGEGGR